MRIVVAVVACLAVGSGCEFPVPPDVGSVGGAVEGMWDGGTVTLRLAAGNATEDLVANAGESFTFVTHVVEGTSYRVSVVDDGPDHDCAVTRASGVQGGADVGDVAVVCTNLIPHGIAISTAVPFSFDPKVTRYVLAVSILQQTTTVIVTGPTLTTARVAGNSLPLGQPSPSVTLGPGQSAVAIEVAKGSLSQKYELVFDRGAATIVEAFRGGPPGTVVAATSDYVAVGVPHDATSTEGGTDSGTPESGAVHIFRRSGTTWLQTQILKGSNIKRFAHFGGSIAMDRNLLVVGAPSQDGPTNETTRAGAVHVFRLSTADGRWREEQRITETPQRGLGNFGYAVAVDNAQIGLSAIPDAFSGPGPAGSVYMMRWSGTWNQEARVQLPNPQAGDGFGQDISLSGDNMVVRQQSTLHAFHRSGASWTRDAMIPGFYAALDGDTLAVGDSSHAGGVAGSGAVRVFRRSGTTWPEVAILKATAPQSNAGLGTGVAIHGDVIATHAPGARQLQVFRTAGGTWTAEPPVVASGPAPTGDQLALTEVGAMMVSEAGQTAWFFR